MINTNQLRKFGRILMTGILVIQILLSYSSLSLANIAQAQAIIPDAIKSDPNASTGIAVPEYKGVDQSIKDYLCVPDEGNLGTALYDCISKIYRFGIAFGAIALVFFIVFAGYLYMAGGESGKQKGKTIFTTALTGMAIILSSYVLLNFINPDLVKIKPIQAPIFTTSGLPKCVDVGFGENCVLPNGQVTGPSIGGGATSASEKQWEPLISKHATANKLPYCALSALIRKESTFNQYAVSNFGGPGRSGSLNPNHSNKKFYDLTFTYAYPGSKYIGHGVGLTQVFIYGPPKAPMDPWQDASTPSRKGQGFGFNRFLTVSDLIDPDTSISAGAYFFGKLYQTKKENLFEAYKAYTGGHENAALKKMVGYYDTCLAAKK